MSAYKISTPTVDKVFYSHRLLIFFFATSIYFKEVQCFKPIVYYTIYKIPNSLG